MGDCFALIGKDSKRKPLYKEQKFYLEDIELSEALTINQNHVKSYHKQGKELVEKMNTYGCSIEKCNNIIDFLLLSKHDFEREKSLKMKIFGKKFENHDSPELTRCYLRAITLGQTFNNDFVFVGKDTNHIPSGCWQTMVFRQMRRIVPPCELAKITLMMMAFVHKEIMDSNHSKSMVKPNELHEQIGARIFFHDRIIERWIKITDFDVVSKEMNKFSRQEKEMALKDLSTYMENIFIIYDNESRSNRDMFNIYVYDGNFLRPSFEIQLEELSKKLLPKVYAICTSKSIDFNKISCH